MLVETYEVTEVDADGDLECEEEAARLTKELGLVGQERFFTKEGPRTPYRKMTVEEKFVYSHILPRKVEMKRYDDGPIPVRVLQVAAHAREQYDLLQVWCPETADQPDPLLVGINGSDYNPKELFILARWGDVLAPFSELAKKAVELFKQTYRNQVEEWCNDLRKTADRLDKMGNEAILADKFKEPNVYIK